MHAHKDLLDSDVNGDYLLQELVNTIMTYRLRYRISQRELSRRSGVAQKTISLMENRESLPTFSTLYKLADALGYEIEFSLTKKEI